MVVYACCVAVAGGMCCGYNRDGACVVDVVCVVVVYRGMRWVVCVACVVILGLVCVVCVWNVVCI